MCTEKKPILSVIVPVYNVAPYLADCVESLMDQGLNEEEYEVIFIDDGSTDNSLEILQGYAKEHPCIKVIHQENAGVSAARNKGLDLAVGEYIAFVDGDDFLQTGALKALCDAAVSYDADVVMYDYLCVEESESYQKTPRDRISFTKNKTGDPVISTFVCNQIVKREIIEANGIRFRVGMKYSEDTLVAFGVAMSIDASRQLFTDKRLYRYRQRAGSAVHTEKKTMQWIGDRLQVIDYYRDFAAEHKNLSAGIKRYIEGQTYALSSSIAMSPLRIETIDAERTLEQLRVRGLYPYPLRFELLKERFCAGNVLRMVLGIPIVFRFFAKTKLLNGR